jgi:hypothetical protein
VRAKELDLAHVRLNPMGRYHGSWSNQERDWLAQVQVPEQHVQV